MRKQERYGTHREALAAAIARSKGPMIEVGAGKYSTPLMLKLAYGRTLVTVEHDPEWRPVASAKHIVLESMDEAIAEFGLYGVALVDGAAAERALAVLALLPKCFYIVVHDTERLMDYPGLEEAIATARYRYDYKDLEPWTSIVSDLVDWE